jgi:mRNA interferase MazF
MAGVDVPRRGDVYWASLDPTVGAEIAKTRPVVIISNDVGNRHSSVVIVAALTSGRGDRVYPFEVLINAGEGGLSRASKILLNQVRTIDKTRLGRRIGALGWERMIEVDAAIRLSLAV